MFKHWVPFGWPYGFASQTHDAKSPKPMSRRTSRSFRNTIFFLLLVSVLTWQLIASQKDLSTLPYLRQTEDHSGPRVAIVVFITKPQTYMHLSLQNKDRYARLHGYDLFVDYESNSSRGTTWLKFDMVERVIKANQHDWVWYLDFDTLITNTSVSLTNLISENLANVTMPNDIDLLVTDDCNGLNDGSFIARSSARSIEFLNGVRALHDREEVLGGVSLSDQDSMARFLKTKDPLVQHAMRIPQWTINAFPEEIGCYDTHKRKWEKGMFVIHFAGAWAHVSGEDPTGQLMKKYEGDIIY
ncbi:uncharacterized protein N7506_012073 [Penicillium brevicompactum]|uniref:uncharacterized protein n=1 Tax=Penicillium brevicompactum TaxID=5074 RepID=UPI0025425041|nr:uncharacterized protein N7506_012073 [Penicillium brevicompactum]KAJ5319369.1 hypothetical protein N7506_012073 [Penicillium brevicompactum]